MREILTALRQELEVGRDAMLVSIADDSGSTPRGAGSQMLVGRSGWLLGTVGGGRVEKASEMAALELLAEGRSQLRSFGLDLFGKPNSLGMACGGQVEIHFQFVPHGDELWRHLTATALDRLEAHQPGWLVLRIDGGPPALLDGAGAPVVGTACPCGLSRHPVRSEDALYLPLPIGQRLVIFGAGHVARALVPLARTVGFRPVIYDDRPQYAVPEAFPAAEAVLCADFREIDRHIDLTPEDYTAVLTSGHVHDLEVEAQLLRRELAYVGVIGSRAKIRFVSQQLRESGISEVAIASVHTPVGTAIKAVTPAEIAVSITGELILERALRRERENGKD